MATINVFELTRQAIMEDRAKASGKQSIQESVKQVEKKETTKIPYNTIKLECVKLREGIEDIDYEPSDEVMLVVDPDMEEEPASEEEAQAAAKELVGKEVCKCPICGANYVCDCVPNSDDTLAVEGLDEDEAACECPVCGEEVEPIVVGEIAPVEGEQPVEEPVANPDEPVADDDTVLNDAPIDDDDDKVDEGCKKQEGVQLKQNAKVLYTFQEKALNKMFTKYARENYSNIRSVRFNKAQRNGTKLSLEGVVRTLKGNIRPVKLVSENFKPEDGVMTLKFREFGPFTESANIAEGKVPFVVKCTCNEHVICPTELKYAYTVKENKDTFKIYGKVLSE